MTPPESCPAAEHATTTRMVLIEQVAATLALDLLRWGARESEALALAWEVMERYADRPLTADLIVRMAREAGAEARQRARLSE